MGHEHVVTDLAEGRAPAALDVLGVLPDDVAARITGWWPKNVEDSAHARAMVAACRRIVAAGRPRDGKQATSVLSIVRQYLIWLVVNYPAIDLNAGPALLTPDRLAVYLTDPAGLAERPKGSSDAALSFLRRLSPEGPGLTPAAVTAPVVAAVPGLDDRAEVEALELTGTVTGPPVLVPAGLDVSGLPHQVGAAVSTYTPTALPQQRWARVAEFCRTAVAAASPDSVRSARSLIRSVAYLAAWVDSNQRPVRPDVVFAPDTIAEFIQLLADRTEPTSAAAHRTNLVRAGTAALPGVAYASLPTFARRKPSGPADDAEIKAAFRWAESRRSEAARRHSAALLILAAGCGLDTTDAGWVTPDDVVDITSGLGVEIRRPDADGTVRLERTTFVLPAYVDPLRKLVTAATEAGDLFLLGGDGNRDRRADTLRRGNGGPKNLIRMRYRWMLDVVDENLLSVETLLAAAGLDTLRVLEDLLNTRPTPANVLAPLARTVVAE